VHVDPAAYDVIEEDTRRTLLTTRFEFGPQPLGEVSESMMHAPPCDRLANLHRKHARRAAFSKREDDSVNLADLASVGIDDLLVQDVAYQRQWFIHRAPPVESRQSQ